MQRGWVSFVLYYKTLSDRVLRQYRACVTDFTWAGKSYNYVLCITLLWVQPIPILSAFFLCHPYIPLSNFIYLPIRTCFSKKEMFTQILLCLFFARHQTLSSHQVSDVGLFRLVRFTSSTGKIEGEEEDEQF